MSLNMLSGFEVGFERVEVMHLARKPHRDALRACVTTVRGASAPAAAPRVWSQICKPYPTSVAAYPD
jgi:hypothetical protein